MLIISAAYFHCNVFKYKYFSVAKNIICKHHINGKKGVSNPELLLYSPRHKQRVASRGDNNNNNVNEKYMTDDMLIYQKIQVLLYL